MSEQNRGEIGQGSVVLEQALDSIIKFFAQGGRGDNVGFEKKRDALRAKIIREFDANEPTMLSVKNFSLIRKLLKATQENFGGCGLNFPYPLSKLTEISEKVQQIFLNFLYKKFPELSSDHRYFLLPKKESVSFVYVDEEPNQIKTGKNKIFTISPDLTVAVSEEETPILERGQEY